MSVALGSVRNLLAASALILGIADTLAVETPDETSAPTTTALPPAAEASRSNEPAAPPALALPNLPTSEEISLDDGRSGGEDPRAPGNPPAPRDRDPEPSGPADVAAEQLAPLDVAPPEPLAGDARDSATVGAEPATTEATNVSAPASAQVGAAANRATEVAPAIDAALQSEPAPAVAATPSAETLPAVATTTRTSVDATPGACCSLPRDQDEVWLVSSYGVGCCGYGPGGPPLRYWKYCRPQGWVGASADEFWSSLAPETHLSVAIPGNRMDMSDATRFGWAIYGAAVRNAPEQPPMRFVIWAWPSGKASGGPANDARVKAARADVDARILASFLQRLPSQSSLSLTGYSFGARIIGGALELVAGGAVNGVALPLDATAAPPPPARVVFMAAAIDNDWLLPGRRYGMAMGRMSHLTLLNNGCDRVLRFYGRMVRKRGGPQALGYTGQAAPGWLGPELTKLEQHDVCCLIGKPHDWEHYTGSPRIASWIAAGLTPWSAAPRAANVPAPDKNENRDVAPKSPAPDNSLEVEAEVSPMRARSTARHFAARSHRRMLAARPNAARQVLASGARVKTLR